jgi:hypothetical protein
MTVKPEVKVGQIWQRNEYLGGEMLPNQGFVRIIETYVDFSTPGASYAKMHACDEHGSVLHPWPNSQKVRSTTAQLERFGRRGGYRLHKDV